MATPHTTSSSTRQAPLPGSGAAHAGLWALQVLLAAAFLFFGAAKLSMSPTALAEVEGVAGSIALVRSIGVAEVLGAVGLVAPAATRILPWLTPLAARALTVVMLLAVGVHLGRDEYPQMVVPLVLAALLAVVVRGRARVRPILPR